SALSASAQESSLDPLKSAAKASPNDPKAALAYGRALRNAGQLPESTDELRRGANLESARTGPNAIALHVELARTEIAKREFGKAMVQCKVVQDLNGGAAEGHACAAEAHLLWRRASEALDEAKKALLSDKNNLDAKVAMGNAYALQLQDADAKATFDEASAIAPNDARPWIGLGRLYVATAKKEDAIAAYKKAVLLDPKDADANFELARILPLPAEAIGYVETATKERPTFAEALAYRATLDVVLGRLADAKTSATAALKLAPQNPNMHVALGRALLAEGKIDDAAVEGKAALAILANLASAKLLVADAYAKKGEIDLAVENYQDAWGFDHSDPTALVNASVACHQAGRDTSAKAFGLRATQEFPTWAPAWVALGDAKAADHDVAGAREAYGNALTGQGPIDRPAIEKKVAGLR
ncbi:MAG TPA: tetratricopeptide repeat protein, partial [Polyangiaceae bacterium]